MGGANEGDAGYHMVTEGGANLVPEGTHTAEATAAAAAAGAAAGATGRHTTGAGVTNVDMASEGDSDTKATELCESSDQDMGPPPDPTKDSKHVHFKDDAKGPLGTTPFVPSAGGASSGGNGGAAYQAVRGREPAAAQACAAAQERAAAQASLRERSVVRSDERVLQEWILPITDGNAIPGMIKDLEDTYGPIEGNTIAMKEGKMMLRVFQYIHTRDLSTLASSYWSRKQTLKRIAEGNQEEEKHEEEGDAQGPKDAGSGSGDDGSDAGRDRYAGVTVGTTWHTQTTRSWTMRTSNAAAGF